MTVKDLLTNINPYKRTFFNFAAVFGIELRDYFIGNPGVFSEYQSIHKELYSYFIKNKDFVDKFYKDWHTNKSMKQLAEQTNQDISEVLNLFNSGKIFTNRGTYGIDFKETTEFRYFSSYQVIELLTGKQVIERPKSLKPVQETAKPSIILDENQKDDNVIKIIGYEDIKSYIVDELAPISNPKDSEDWGLNNPGGILLYGPPGCGKTLWANWIAQFLKYEFIEIPRSVFGSTYVDGAMNNLKKVLDDLKCKKNLVVFFDEFDSVAAARTDSSNASGSENAKVVNTLLQEIPKLISKQIVLVAATNFIDSLDPAVIRPGRFDLKLPIFPPLPEERINLLFNSIISDPTLNKLKNSSPLLEILKNNNLLDKDKWMPFSNKLSLFSNSQVIDTAKIIKRKIKQQHKAENFSTKFILSKDVIEISIKEAKAKLTSKDIQTLNKFLIECKSLQLDIFNERINALQFELDPYDKSNKRTPIGFNTKRQ